MPSLRRLALLPIAMLIVAACQPSGQGSTSASASASTSASASASQAAGKPCESGAADGLLAQVCDAGKIVVSTDPAYPPQSFLDKDTGEYKGFDIDVATEIADRLGVDVEFTDPTFDAVVAGNWSGRWDMSVGSVTVTSDRERVLDFTQAYYYTPAQMAVLKDSSFQSLDDLAGKVVCAGESTTYVFWIEGTLHLPEGAQEPAAVPDGMTDTTFPTDIDCAEAWRGGRNDFDGWLTALPTAQDALDSGKYDIRLLGDPVFFEPLAVAFDKSVDDNDSLVAAVDQIVGEMHDDGTLTELSKNWYEGIDYSVQQ